MGVLETDTQLIFSPRFRKEKDSQIWGEGWNQGSQQENQVNNILWMKSFGLI